MTGSLPDRAALTSHNVHIFLISTDSIAPATLAHFEAFLSPDERQKIARLRFPARRIESLASRATLRQLLAHFLQTPPQQITLNTTAQGKPFLQNSPLRFNLSHTQGMALIALTRDHELGIDIESIPAESPPAPPAPSFDFEALARRFFTPAEHAALQAFPPAERLRAFYRCWTRKESLLKGTGQGISGLKTFQVPLHPSASPISLPGPLDKWTLHDLAVPATHIASLAIESPNPHLHHWAMPPPAGDA